MVQAVSVQEFSRLFTYLKQDDIVAQYIVTFDCSNKWIVEVVKNEFS